MLTEGRPPGLWRHRAMQPSGKKNSGIANQNQDRPYWWPSELLARTAWAKKKLQYLLTFLRTAPWAIQRAPHPIAPTTANSSFLVKLLGEAVFLSWYLEVFFEVVCMYEAVSEMQNSSVANESEGDQANRTCTFPLWHSGILLMLLLHRLSLVNGPRVLFLPKRP